MRVWIGGGIANSAHVGRVSEKRPSTAFIVAFRSVLRGCRKV